MIFAEAAAALLAAAAAPAADAWPVRPVRLLVTSPLAGANDTQARVLGVKLGEQLGQADVRERLAALGYEVIATTPQDMDEKIRSDAQTWAKVISDSGARAELTGAARSGKRES